MAPPGPGGVSNTDILDPRILEKMDDDDDETRENDFERRSLFTSMCGHFSAIMAMVGPPTYPAPMQHTVLSLFERERERKRRDVSE